MQTFEKEKNVHVYNKHSDFYSEFSQLQEIETKAERERKTESEDFFTDSCCLHAVWLIGNYGLGVKRKRHFNGNYKIHIEEITKEKNLCENNVVAKKWLSFSGSALNEIIVDCLKKKKRLPSCWEWRKLPHLVFLF